MGVPRAVYQNCSAVDGTCFTSACTPLPLHASLSFGQQHLLGVLPVIRASTHEEMQQDCVCINKACRASSSPPPAIFLFCSCTCRQACNDGSIASNGECCPNEVSHYDIKKQCSFQSLRTVSRRTFTAGCDFLVVWWNCQQRCTLVVNARSGSFASMFC